MSALHPDGSEARDEAIVDSQIIARLKRENAEFKAQLAHMAALNEQLIGDIVVLRQQVAELQRGEDMSRSASTQLWTAQP